MSKLVNIGFGNSVNADRVIAVASPVAAPVKRLVSPFEGNFAAWQFANADQSEVLVCHYQRLSLPLGTAPERLKIVCDPSATYEDAAGNRYSGGMLMHIGLPMPLSHGDFGSTVIHLKKI